MHFLHITTCPTLEICSATYYAIPSSNEHLLSIANNRQELNKTNMSPDKHLWRTVHCIEESSGNRNCHQIPSAIHGTEGNQTNNNVCCAEILENKVPGQRQQFIGVTDDPRLNPIKDWNHFNHHTRLIHHGDRDPEYLQDRDPKYLSGEHADSARAKDANANANATRNYTQFIISNE